MTRLTDRRDEMPPAERWEIEHQKYWNGSIFPVEWSSASVIAGLEIPIVGGMVGLALDHSIEATIAMMEDPDTDLRWTDDTALVLRGKLLAIVRRTSRGADITRFDGTPPLPSERVIPGRRASRMSSIILIDGSLDSTCQGLGIPLAGRDLAGALEAAIRSICDGVQHHDPAGQEADDVALSYRGRFQAVIRFAPSGPVVTRFDVADSTAGGGVDPKEGRDTPPFPVHAGGRDWARHATAGLSPTSLSSRGPTH